jgi:rubrerythrin
VTCGACRREIFAADVCPRCHAPDGLARALETGNGWPVPAACPVCEGEEIRYVALVPARVAYEGKRADRARSVTELHDPGFHGYRVDCRDCGTVAQRSDGCPLCDAPGPLRLRPG